LEPPSATHWQTSLTTGVLAHLARGGSTLWSHRNKGGGATLLPLRLDIPRRMR